MIPRPSLGDVITETLTEAVRGYADADRWVSLLTAALLAPLTAREQALEADSALVDALIDVADKHCRGIKGRQPDRSDIVALVDVIFARDVSAEQRAEAAEARVSALTAENAKLNERLDYMHGVHQSCGDALSMEMHKVSALTAEREALHAWLTDERAFADQQGWNGRYETLVDVLAQIDETVAGEPSAPVGDQGK